MRTAKVRRLDLKKRLALWALLLSGGCLIVASGCLLAQAGHRVEARTASITDLAARAFKLQAEQEGWVGARSSPADAERIATLLLASGMCLTYDTAQREQHLCAGMGLAAGSAPAWFKRTFDLMFGQKLKGTRDVVLSDRKVGVVHVESDPADSAAEAWDGITPVLGTLSATLLTLCALLYLTLRRVLAPTRLIQDGLQKLAADDLTARLPSFDLGELSEIGTVFNRLALRLEESLGARDSLMRQIVTAQDDERRSLARDLHDEFGQCLAGTAALLAAMRYTACRDSPALTAQCDAAAAAVATMMASLRDVMLRLRPPELEALGLSASLRHMIAVWNGQCLGSTVFEMDVLGDSAMLPPLVAEGLYRIAQEALTNAARHADATRIVLRLAVIRQEVSLAIEDDGLAVSNLAPGSGGFGVLGMQERAASMGGRLTMDNRHPRGLRVAIRIPLQHGLVASAQQAGMA